MPAKFCICKFVIASAWKLYGNYFYTRRYQFFSLGVFTCSSSGKGNTEDSVFRFFRRSVIIDPFSAICCRIQFCTLLPSIYPARSDTVKIFIISSSLTSISYFSSIEQHISIRLYDCSPRSATNVDSGFILSFEISKYYDINTINSSTIILLLINQRILAPRSLLSYLLFCI